MRWLVILCACVALPASAEVDSPQDSNAVHCPKAQGMIRGPVVKTKQAAFMIFKAVELDIAPKLLEKYPVFVGEDEGDSWLVFQTSPPSSVPPKPGEIIVSAGGGMLSMRISKCDGAISEMHYNR